jgi:signal transduction histidine kinase
MPLRCRKIEQVLNNLISNAVKYSEDGSCVTVGLRQDGPEASITVSDRGVGIAADQVQRTFNAILKNAMEAMPKGGSITLSARVLAENPSNIQIEMTDTGKGIPAAVLPRVFVPYFSTKQRGVQKGMGLGLVVAQALVKGHGGQITIASVEGRSTPCTVQLPIR